MTIVLVLWKPRTSSQFFFCHKTMADKLGIELKPQQSNFSQGTLPAQSPQKLICIMSFWASADNSGVFGVKSLHYGHPVSPRGSNLAIASSKGVVREEPPVPILRLWSLILDVLPSSNGAWKPSGVSFSNRFAFRLT